MKQIQIYYNTNVKFSRSNYDKRRIPTLYFTRDYSVKNKDLFIDGDEYTTYNYNYETMIDLLHEGIISETIDK